MFQVATDARQNFYKTFNKTEDKVEQDIQTVKKWVKRQRFPEVMEDAKIRNFLHLNKFDLERTKEKIEAYYSVRVKIPDLFENGNPKLPSIQRVLDTTYCSTHPKAVDGVQRVIHLKMKEPNVFSPSDLAKLALCIFEIRLYEDCMVEDIIVFDLSNLSFRDMGKISPSFVIHAFKVYKNIFSLRLKVLHFLNSPLYVSVWMALMKFILKPKIFDRVRVHRDSEVLKRIYSNEDLPQDYGGCGPSLEQLNEMVRDKLKEYQPRFDQMDKLTVKKK